MKIPLKDSKTSIAGFASSIQKIIDVPSIVEKMSCGAIARAKELTWSAKAESISKVYLEVVH